MTRLGWFTIALAAQCVCSAPGRAAEAVALHLGGYSKWWLVGAWQTSLSLDAEAPATFHLLADALFRMNDGAQALAILTEAAEKWPDDDEFLRPLATAYAMTSRYAEAFGALERHLAKKPSDPDGLFLAMRMIYEAHVSGRPLVGAQQDRDRLTKYAKAYAQAGGPQQPIVAQWVRYLSPKP